MSCQKNCSLTSKDLTILEDQLTHLANVSRVAASYANAFQDPAMKQSAMAIAKHHCDQFGALMGVLNGCNN
ncbi:MAG: hypothetical protein IJB69_08790 [Clostridia bacterium]|nr:hypothetical protein [Clostridia bacterium]